MTRRWCVTNYLPVDALKNHPWLLELLLYRWHLDTFDIKEFAEGLRELEREDEAGWQAEDEHTLL